MKTKTLYSKNFVEILNPNWTEYLWDIIAKIKDADINATESEIKTTTLSFINLMLENKIIYVGDKFSNKRVLIKWNLSNSKILKKIDIIWFEGAKYPDYYSMAWFQ